jgi:hypothetical protein
MLNNIFIVLLSIFLVNTSQVFALDKTNVTAVNAAMVKKLIANHMDNQRNINTKGLEPSDNQSFKISINKKTFYIVSSIRNSPEDDPSICTVLLFNENKTSVSAIDTLGIAGSKRPWACDDIEAMSFMDYYKDGNLKIIALYSATAPSSDQLNVPVVLKLDINTPSLVVDEYLTNKIKGKQVNSIKSARSLLKKYSEK